MTFQLSITQASFVVRMGVMKWRIERLVLIKLDPLKYNRESVIKLSPICYLPSLLRFEISMSS